MTKTKAKTARYFALHVDGLRNGSFFRVYHNGETVQYINGDFMNHCNELPKTYAGLPLVEYQAKDALMLIPACCR